MIEFHCCETIHVWISHLTLLITWIRLAFTKSLSPANGRVFVLFRLLYYQLKDFNLFHFSKSLLTAFLSNTDCNGLLRKLKSSGCLLSVTMLSRLMCLPLSCLYSKTGFPLSGSELNFVKHVRFSCLYCFLCWMHFCKYDMTGFYLSWSSCRQSTPLSVVMAGLKLEIAKYFTSMCRIFSFSHSYMRANLPERNLTTFNFSILITLGILCGLLSGPNSELWMYVKR